METHHHTTEVYDKLLKIFTIVAGWVVGAAAVYMLYGLFSRFISVTV